MPGDPQRREADDEADGDVTSEPSDTSSEDWQLAQDLATEMFRAYGSSLERDAGTDFKSPRLQKTAYNPA